MNNHFFVKDFQIKEWHLFLLFFFLIYLVYIQDSEKEDKRKKTRQTFLKSMQTFNNMYFY